MANCRKKPLALGGMIAALDALQAAWHKAGFRSQIIGKWRAAVASRVPIGYEDETGFHYGVKPGEDGSLIFNSGGGSFFSAGSFTPTSLTAVARIGNWASKASGGNDADNVAKRFKLPAHGKRLGRGIIVGPAAWCRSPTKRTGLSFADKDAR